MTMTITTHGEGSQLHAGYANISLHRPSLLPLCTLWACFWWDAVESGSRGCITGCHGIPLRLIMVSRGISHVAPWDPVGYHGMPVEIPRAFAACSTRDPTGPHVVLRVPTCTPRDSAGFPSMRLPDGMSRGTCHDNTAGFHDTSHRSSHGIPRHPPESLENPLCRVKRLL